MSILNICGILVDIKHSQNTKYCCLYVNVVANDVFQSLQKQSISSHGTFISWHSHTYLSLHKSIQPTCSKLALQ